MSELLTNFEEFSPILSILKLNLKLRRFLLLTNLKLRRIKTKKKEKTDKTNLIK